MSSQGRITSTSNPRLKAAARLRGRRERDREGLTLIDGVRETLRALSGGAVLREVFVVPELLVEPEAKALLERLREESVPAGRSRPEAFEKLAYGDRLDGVVAVAETPLRTLATLVLPRRAADRGGRRCREAGQPGRDPAHGRRRRPGRGHRRRLRHRPVQPEHHPGQHRNGLRGAGSRRVERRRPDLARAIASIAIIAARVDASVDYTDGRLPRRGWPSRWAARRAVYRTRGASWRATSVHVPMLGVADSLNVSATAAILFYEALRQRRALNAG